MTARAAVLVLILGAAAAVLVLTGESGRPAVPGRRGLPIEAVGALPVGHVRAPPARARHAIQRLIRLGLPVYCGGHRGRELAFTFDDGPGIYTHDALRKLAAARQRATFFVVGRSIEAWPGYLSREARLGAIGDHTFTHHDLLMMSRAAAHQELAATRRLIERGSRRQVVLFRPPYGARDASVDAIARSLGLLEVLWSVDSADSLGANYRGIIHNVELGMRPGAIIEMHENRGQTIRALDTLLPALARRHLRSVSLVQLMTSDPPSLTQLRRGQAGCGRPGRIARRGGE